MKCKAAESGLSPELVTALNKARPQILSDVLVPHLHVPKNFGSSEFYVQRCDSADDETHKPFCEVRLSGVSVNDDRSVNDFVRAQKALEDLYRRKIELGREVTSEPVELTVSIMLDKPPKEGGTTIIGDKPIMVRGALHKSR